MATKDINLMLCITVRIAILKHKSKCNIRLICLIVTARWPWHNNKISDRSQVDTVQCLHDGVIAEIHRDIIIRPQSHTMWTIHSIITSMLRCGDLLQGFWHLHTEHQVRVGGRLMPVTIGMVGDPSKHRTITTRLWKVTQPSSHTIVVVDSIKLSVNLIITLIFMVRL